MGPNLSKKKSPYEDAARLPEGERVDIRALVSGTFFEIEVGPGRGMFILERALAVPEAGLLGLEIRRKWAAIVDERLAKRGLGARARVLAEDAKDALGRLGPDASVRRVFLLFPDPWWKKRHEKRLVMGEPFLGEIARLLEPRGELFIETDVEERAAQYEEQVRASGKFAPDGDEAGSARVADHDYVARTNREKRAMADGLPVYRMRFRKAGADAGAGAETLSRG